eukprot:scaffold680569_cov60-Prasinocladus_malaysianus.AAC.1
MELRVYLFDVIQYVWVVISQVSKGCEFTAFAVNLKNFNCTALVSEFRHDFREAVDGAQHVPVLLELELAEVRGTRGVVCASSSESPAVKGHARSQVLD